jgi:adenylate cyclase
VIQIFYPALALVLTATSIITFRYFSEERRRQFLRLLFRRYVPAEILGRVIEAIDRGEVPLSGTRRIVTVLYADLRGFAVLPEETRAEVVLQTVNRYMELAMQAISGHGGIVSKPMGDALVAIWNAPLDQIDHCARGLQAAVEIRQNILQFQKRNPEQERFSVGIGLATGWAVMGNLSALGKVEYTLVGDTVNVAARISAFANNNQILADTSTAQAAPPEIVIRELSPVRVRGRKEPLPVWDVREVTPLVPDETEEPE